MSVKSIASGKNHTIEFHRIEDIAIPWIFKFSSSASFQLRILHKYSSTDFVYESSFHLWTGRLNKHLSRNRLQINRMRMTSDNIAKHIRIDRRQGMSPKITISIHSKTLKTVIKEPLMLLSRPTNTDLYKLIKPSTTKNRRDSVSRLLANLFRNGLTTKWQQSTNIHKQASCRIIL